MRCYYCGTVTPAKDAEGKPVWYAPDFYEAVACPLCYVAQELAFYGWERRSDEDEDEDEDEDGVYPCIGCGEDIGIDGYCTDSTCANYKGAMYV